jgi:hypothetical protein
VVYRVVVHRRGGVDDAVAAGEGGAEAATVEQVDAHHRQPLCRAVERPQVRVLRVIGAAGCAADGVAAGEEELDDPRPDEPAGAGDADDGGGHRRESNSSQESREDEGEINAGGGGDVGGFDLE